MALRLFNIFGRNKRKKIAPEEIKFHPTILYKPKEGIVKRRRFHFKFSIPRLLWGMLFFLLTSLLVVSLYQFVRNPYFQIKDFKILGNRNITSEDLINSLNKYKDNHIYLVNTERVEKELRQAYEPLIDGVDIDKIWPDKLFIKISEREPKLVYVNLNGAYIVDNEGLILKELFTDNIDFTAEKIRIARGYGSADDPLIRETFLNEFTAKLLPLNLPPAELSAKVAAEFNYDAIALSEKQRVISLLQEQFMAEAQSFWSSNARIVEFSDYASFPRVKVLNNDKLDRNSQVDLDRLNLSLEVTNFADQRQIPVVDIIWEGELLVKVETLEKRYLVFGLNRKPSLQFEDLLLVLQDLALRGKSYSVIDVSATKVLVVH